MPNEKKIFILLPDGIGLKNFVFSKIPNELSKKNFNFSYWNATPFDLTKNELNEMRKLWDFHGISQLNKAELIQELTKRIADNLESWLQYLGSEQTEFLKEIIKCWK